MNTPKLPELPEPAHRVSYMTPPPPFGLPARWEVKNYYTAAQMEAYARAAVEATQPESGGQEQAVAWMHEVTADDGEPDQALSFSRDSFPLEGVAGYRTVYVRPLVYGDALRAQPAGGGDTVHCPWNDEEGSAPPAFPAYRGKSPAPPHWALPAVENALNLLDHYGYIHTDLAAVRDWLKEKSA